MSETARVLLCVIISSNNKIIVVNLTHKIMYSTTFACLLAINAMLLIGTKLAQNLITQVTKYYEDLF